MATPEAKKSNSLAWIAGILLLAAVVCVLPSRASAAENPARAHDLARGSPAPLAPPLAPPLRLTGTFGEYRSGHLHSGVDLSTGGVTGLPVLATDSGTIVRMRAGAYGYGRAVSLLADGGLLVVYGHLDHFVEPLEEYLSARQHEAGEYEIDLALEPGRFRFERGDTIAYSGATGVGPPHLHFELRAGEMPINPLVNGLDAADNGGPQIGPVALHALSPASWVAGGSTMTISLPADSIPVVWGAIGVEVFVVDRSGTTTARLAPLAVRLYLDGEPLFERRFAQLDFARDSEVDRIYGRLARDEGPFALRLYRWPPAAAPDETVTEAISGAILPQQPRPGMHDLCLEIEEASGFVTEASWRIDSRPPLLPRAWRAMRSGADEWQLGIQLGSPFDSTRLPLQLEWSKAAATVKTVAASDDPGNNAAETGRITWSALGDGWFATPLRASGPIDTRVTDARGISLLPTIRIGDQQTGASSIETAVRVEEGGALILVHADPPLPGLPQAALLSVDGEVAPLVMRGVGPRDEWIFALDHGALVGWSDALQLDFPGSKSDRTIQLTKLFGVRSNDETRVSRGEHAQRVGEAELTVIDPGPSFFGSAVLHAGGGIPGDSLARALVDEAGRCAWRRASPERGKLPIAGAPISIGPSWWPLSAPLRMRIEGAGFTIPADADSRRWGLCRADDDGDWSWLGGRPTARGFEAETERLGVFALLEDDFVPAIAAPEPADGAIVASSPSRLAIGVTECGSGFDPRAADILLDGEMLLAAWDVDEGILSVALARPLAAGEHDWEARVVDRAGNSARSTFAFTIAPQSSR